jgi:hypothetical protein
LLADQPASVSRNRDAPQPRGFVVIFLPTSLMLPERRVVISAYYSMEEVRQGRMSSDELPLLGARRRSFTFPITLLARADDVIESFALCQQPLRFLLR